MYNVYTKQPDDLCYISHKIYMQNQTFFFLFSYIIDELHSSNEFLLSVNLSVCLETTECMINRTVAENVRLPKPTCNWNTGYKIPGKK